MTIIIIGNAETRNVSIQVNGVYTLLDPKKSQAVYNHNPEGFNWGYGGSGPAQLALAILLECTDTQTAKRNYQQFKFDVIAGLARGKDFTILIDISKYIIPNPNDRNDSIRDSLKS